MPEPFISDRPVLAHRDLGGSGDLPIVILHGMLGSSRNWQTAGRELAARHRVFALDLRNHGLSPRDPDMTYEAMAADVAAWLDAQGIARATLLGHSMGGKVAMLLACRQPGRVERLIVVDIAPKDYFWPAHRAEFAAMSELELSDLKSRADAEIRMEGRVPNRIHRKFLLSNLEHTSESGWRWLVNLSALIAALPELERNPLRPGDCFEGPALFVVGAKSGYVKPGDEGLIHLHFPSARIETLAQSGHNPHIEAREAFITSVSAPSTIH